MANIAAVHSVLTTCGVGVAATHNVNINVEGFDTLSALGILETADDVTEMAKRLASRRPADGRAILGTVQIKRIQALIWWIRDREKRQLPLDAADFTAGELRASMENREIEKGRTESSVAIGDLPKFDPDDYDTHEDAFLNAMAQTYGVMNEPLRYVIRPHVDPGVYVNTAKEQMFQM